MSNWRPTEWWEWGSANWNESWNDCGSSWWGDDRQQTSTSEQKKEAAIKARRDKQEAKAAKPPHFAPDAFQKWQAGINKAVAGTRSNSAPPLGKAQKTTPPPSAQLQTALADGPRDVLMQKVAHCVAKMTAGTSHSELCLER